MINLIHFSIILKLQSVRVYFDRITTAGSPEPAFILRVSQNVEKSELTNYFKKGTVGHCSDGISTFIIEICMGGI